MRTEETRAPETSGGQVGRWLMGGLLVIAGAVSGAFGAVAWLEALRIPSLLLALVAIVLLGVVPVMLGLGLVWTGLGVIEDEQPGATRMLDLMSDDALVDATQGGSTRDEVVTRIGACDLGEAERRLDDLVVREVLDLDVTEEGRLVYRPHA
jgi:hypothetical protein